MHVKIFALALPLFLISCIEVRDSSKIKPTNELSAEVMQPVPQPVVEIRPLSRPQQYAVTFKNVNPLSQITRRSDDLLLQSETVSVAVEKAESQDIIEKAGHYSYLIQQDGQTFELPVDIPQDYVIEGNMTLDQLETNIRRDNDHYRVLETSGRVFFNSGATLTTNGENLLLKANTIESEGALIQTLPGGLKATIGKPGRHGGDIKLEAQSLRGTLQFFMRGESGGDGEGDTMLQPKPIEQLDNNGKNGGNSGFLEVAIKDLSRGGITFNLEPGLGGEGVPVIIFCLDKKICHDIVKKPKGLKGYDGVAQQPIGIQ